MSSSIAYAQTVSIASICSAKVECRIVVEWYSVHTNGVAMREMAQRNVEWYSVHTNSVALREMGQRNVEWYSVHTNGVALREMAQHGVGGTAYMETV